MQPIQHLMTITAIAFGLCGPAMAAVSDPEIIIYRFPGVRDDGGSSGVGVTTAFHCTNFSGVLENIRFVFRDQDGSLLANFPTSMPHLTSVTIGTHGVTAYGSQVAVGTGQVSQGTTAIAATTVNMVCTALTIDASTAAPVGVALRGIRFSPAPGSQE
jgi:hypothetical protein